MKKTFKNYLKLSILLLCVSFQFISCDKDDTAIVNETIVTQRTGSDYSVTKISFKDFDNNQKVISKLSDIRTKSKQTNSTSSKSVSSTNNDFTIYTEEVTYMESSDGTYHSYTFPIIRNEPINGLENLLLSLQEDGSYKASIVTYDLNNEELENLNSGILSGLTDKVSEASLEDEQLVSNILARETDISITLLDCECCTSHASGGCTHPITLVTISGGTGAPDPIDLSGNTGTTDPTNTSTTGATSPTTADTEAIKTLLIDYIKDCIPTANIDTFNIPNLTSIKNYLEGNCTTESQQFALQAIDALDNDGVDDGQVDFLNELILDESFVNDAKLKCVYDKLKASNSNLFKATIGNFVNNPKLKMTIKKGNCINTNDACCDDSNITTTGVVNLIIEDTSGSVLDIAATILHEAIHAEISRYVLLQAPNEDVNDRPRILELYKYYKNYLNEGNIEHVYMTEQYINPIASALRKLDDFSYPIDYYKSYAWDGLRHWDASSLLSMTENSNYFNYRAIVEANTSLSCD